MITFLITVYVFSCIMAYEAYLLLPGLALVSEVRLLKESLKTYKVIIWVLFPGFNLIVAIGTFIGAFYASKLWWNTLAVRAGATPEKD